MRKNILALATIGMLLLSSLMIMPTVGASNAFTFKSYDYANSWSIR